MPQSPPPSFPQETPYWWPLKLLLCKVSGKWTRWESLGWGTDFEHGTAGSIAVGRVTEKALWLTHAIVAKNSMEQLVSCQNDLKEEMWNVSAWCINRELFGQNWTAKGGTSKVVTHPSLAFHLSLMCFCVTASFNTHSLICILALATSPDSHPEIHVHTPREITEEKTHWSAYRCFIQTKFEAALGTLAITTFLEVRPFWIVVVKS